jgi:hypothetical protein
MYNCFLKENMILKALRVRLFSPPSKYTLIYIREIPTREIPIPYDSSYNFLITASIGGSEIEISRIVLFSLIILIN